MDHDEADMSLIKDTVRRFSGPSQNVQFAALLRDLADVAIACIAHFRETAGHDLKGIIAFEHQGDAIVDRIHELLDNAFILRFDISDAMRLTDDLDNVIDGMRKAAFHLDIYRPVLDVLRPEAIELMAIGESMIKDVARLIALLAEPKLPITKVRELARVIDEGEAKADRIVADAERRLVHEYMAPGANRLEFIAWDKLYQMLEETTDEANHCGKLIMSLARKEA
jgi:uncharacterized protein Yka (UPF0111/DUF47 family)